MKDLKNKIEVIIEQSISEKPACKNCKSFSKGMCTFGCMNERNTYGYKVGSMRMTTPEYSCSNFQSVYKFNESVVEVLNDILKDVERVNEAKKNIDLLLNGKLSESDFVDIMR